MDDVKNEFDLKAELKALGMTQKDFAEKIGMTEKTVSGWINQKVKIPNNLTRLIELLKIESSYYLILKALDNTNNLPITINKSK